MSSSKSTQQGTSASFEASDKGLCFKGFVDDRQRGSLLYKRNVYLLNHNVSLSPSSNPFNPRDVIRFQAAISSVADNLDGPKTEYSVLYFASKLNFELGGFQRRLIYGPSTAPLERVLGLSSPGQHAPKYLRHISLNDDGRLGLFYSPEDWDSTAGLGGFTVSNAKLYERPGLCLIRGDEAEVGLLYDSSNIMTVGMLRSDTNLFHKFGIWKTIEYGDVGKRSRGFAPILCLPNNVVTVLHPAQRGDDVIKSVPSGPSILVFHLSSSLVKGTTELLADLFSWISFKQPQTTVRNPRDIPQVGVKELQGRSKHLYRMQLPVRYEQENEGKVEKVDFKTMEPNMEKIRAYAQSRLASNTK